MIVGSWEDRTTCSVGEFLERGIEDTCKDILSILCIIAYRENKFLLNSQVMNQKFIL
jgi:hypothetical protein